MTIKPGAFRFNTDSMKLEIFRGSANYNGTASMAGIGTLAAGQWEEIQATSPDIQTGGTRGLIFPGYGTGFNDVIEYINLDSTGNSIDFGNLTESRFNIAPGASRTRGIMMGGENSPGPQSDVIDFVTIASTGNATDFGNLISALVYAAGLSNSTRGISAGGATPSNIDVIQYVTIASTGNAVDFGNIGTGERQRLGACATSTRGIIAGGAAPGRMNSIEFITIATQGNSADFGDLTEICQNVHGCSNSVRGLFNGRIDSPGAITNTIDYITVATLGNAIDFGDMTERRRGCGAMASPTRGVFSCGNKHPSGTSNVIDYVQIMSTGNAVDFGDTTFTAGDGSALSNGHGGL